MQRPLRGRPLPPRHECRGFSGIQVTRFELRDTPAMMNQSRAPRLTGWCGSTNNRSTYARGMAQVVRMSRNGRALVSPLEGEALQAGLEELGYPELSEDD